MTPNDTERIIATQASMEAKLDDAIVDIGAIKVEVKKTNGRVNKIDERHAREDATLYERERVAHIKAENRQRWGGWFQPVVSGLVVGLIVLLTSLALTHQI